MPWDIATTLPERVREGWMIAIGRYEGNEFDFESWQWKKREGSTDG
jgi:hypothetical protein